MTAENNPWFGKLIEKVNKFKAAKNLGLDPCAEIYEERRRHYSLFTPQLTDAEIEQLRGYIFNYDKLPSKPSDKPVETPNLIAGKWSMGSKTADMKSLGDRRITLAKMPDSGPEDVDAAITYAFDFWQSLRWSEETMAYRKHVVKNFSRMMNYFYAEISREIRVCIPKTKLEADKDFWEAKRAADHLEGSVERAMMGTMIPPMVEGQSYWKNEYMPGGVAAVFTPMNFIWGIPVIQFVGAYLSGCPFIYKGHPFGAIPNTSMMRMLMAAGADPQTVQKVEGFGGRIGSLVSDKRVSVVSVTGSDETAAHMQKERGLRPVKFEGGGCNWAFVDEDFSDGDLQKIAVRLAYSKLGFSSHKCTTLNGIAGTKKTLSKLLPMISKEMDNWRLANPTDTENNDTKVVGPCMVHKAQTATNIQEAAKKAGATVLRAGGKVTGNEYADNAEVIAPVILSDVTPEMKITVDWDGKGERTIGLATTEWFMPILIGCSMNFEEFLKFSLITNTHDLAVSLWTRSDEKLSKARHVLAGMLKENDGTDSALEWEEFGAGGVGPSGNMGVGDPEGTFAIYCRKQKGRHLVF